MNIKQWIADWAKENNYTGKEDFWDFFYDMKPDVDCQIWMHSDIDGEDFDEWYDYDFYEIAKPIMMELFGYKEEDIEYV